MHTGVVKYRSCAASIKTNKNNTNVTVFNTKHSCEHPVTMRTLSSSLQAQSSSPALWYTCYICRSTSGRLNILLATYQCIFHLHNIVCMNVNVEMDLPSYEDLITEITTLRRDIDRLKKEFHAMGCYIIRSNLTHLLQFTDHILTASLSSQIDNAFHSPTMVEYSAFLCRKTQFLKIVLKFFKCAFRSTLFLKQINVIHQNAQGATSEIYDTTLMCQGLRLGCIHCL